jgi:hypothetical protein
VAPNGRIAAIDDGDGHLWWWDLDRARQKFGSEPDDACAVEGVRFSRNSRLALINQFDGHIFKDLATGRPVAAYGSPTFGNSWWSGSLSADGDSLAVPSRQRRTGSVTWNASWCTAKCEEDRNTRICGTWVNGRLSESEWERFAPGFKHVDACR